MKDAMPKDFGSDESWKDGWLGALRVRNLQPVIIEVCSYDAERTAFDALKKSGARLFNKHTPPAPPAGAEA
jgi:hypothetical protein